MAKRYWLMKSDPETYGLRHLKREKGQTTYWDGVRNYQARNFMRDEMKKGDGVLFYHSQEKPPAVVATCKITRSGYPDPSQFDRRSKYYDPKSTKEAPRWYVVDVTLDREFASPVTLPEIKETPGLEDMMVARKGSRLSIQPVTPEEWKIVRALGRRKGKSS